MSHRINHTGRRKLRHEGLNITLVETSDGKPLSFNADLRIPEDLQIVQNHKVYVEAYVKASCKRFDFGVANRITPPTDLSLSELDSGANVLFRVKVVDESDGVARIAALADKVRPKNESDDNNRKPLLPLVSKDLGEQLWVLAKDEGAEPILNISNAIPDFKDRIVNDPLLRAAIFPHVIREIAFILYGDEGEEDGWVERWKEWFRISLAADFDHDLDEEERKTAVEQIVDRFCEKKRFVSSAKALIDK
ncbi:hypothetical protein [Alloalcanivorax marinus]|uniref:hypothetical protein n=1 Tax=Alloalcanivorax marinus TaxID=1177169 RepID=UPI001957C64F|nr:hypothetical protein [Alloalcanivorax marinus]MBM7332885.1 hypothetical protein [Alloalcanivorax marinus]